MKIKYVDAMGVAVELTNAELAVVKNALRQYAETHTYGRVMMRSMETLFELDRPLLDEEDKRDET